MKYFRNGKTLIIGVLLIAAAWKALFLIWGVIPFNSDEAIVALMARHILAGERPVFFYGQAYMGSLDAFLAAACFGLFGQQVWCIRLVQCLLYLGSVATTIWIGTEAFDDLKTGWIAGLLMALPTVNTTLYTTVSLGGYGEALFLGNLILLLAIMIARRKIVAPQSRFPMTWSVAWGICAGIGLWANGLTLVYSAPAGMYLLWFLLRRQKKWTIPFLGSAAAGFLIGSLPWWVYAVTHGPDRLLLELFGTAVDVEQVSWLLRTGNHLVNFLLLGVSVILGMRPPWSVDWLGLPWLPLILLFWAATAWYCLKKIRSADPARPGFGLLLGVGGILLAGFLFTPFGVDPSGRYFLPLAAPMALIASHFIVAVTKRPWQAALLLTLLVGYNAWRTISCALHFPPGLTTQFYEPTRIDHRADEELIQFLRDQGETRGYANYWVAYPLAFLSKEELIFIPRLPYHLDLRYTPRDDRYAPYGARVAASQKTAYITTHNPLLDQHLRTRLQALGVTWQEKQIGDYRVYYALSQTVRPQELGLGEWIE